MHVGNDVRINIRHEHAVDPDLGVPVAHPGADTELDEMGTCGERESMGVAKDAAGIPDY